MTNTAGGTYVEAEWSECVFIQGSTPFIVAVEARFQDADTRRGPRTVGLWVDEYASAACDGAVLEMHGWEDELIVGTDWAVKDMPFTAVSGALTARVRVRVQMPMGSAAELDNLYFGYD